MSIHRVPTTIKLEAILVLIVLLIAGFALVVALQFAELVIALLFWLSPIVLVMAVLYTLTLRAEVRSLRERLGKLEDRTQKSEG